MSDPLLELVGVQAGYKGPVVGPVSLAVGRGEVIGLAGANGSGKSTLLRAIAGSARVLGGVIRRAPRLRSTLLPQRLTRLPEMPITVSQFLAILNAEKDVPAELSELLPRRIDRLSGGQFQLVQVWTCLGSPVDLVILDEPTNNMDPMTVEVLAGLLLQGRHGRGVLVVSHEHDFLNRIADRIVEVAP